MSEKIMNDKKLVLFGAGERASRTVNLLSDWYEIAYLCDNDKEKWYTELKGIPIYPPSRLLEDDKENLVVEITTDGYRNEIANWLEENGVFYAKTHFFSVPHSYLLERSTGRKLLVYGTGSLSQEISSMLIHKGFSIDYYIDSAPAYIGFTNKDVKHYLDLVYEDTDSYFVILANESESYAETKEKFLQLGLVEDVNFTYYATLSIHGETLNFYDVMLSYNRVKEELEGFEIFGDTKNKDAQKIVTLGGSTTESYRESSRTWAPLLADMLNDNGIPTILYCGGVVGYNSSQELLKLIRDVIPMNPDVVLSYSGINDISSQLQPNNIRNKRPFVTDFQIYYLNTILKDFPKEKRTVYYGLENNKTLPDIWVDNIRTMRAIAKEFNIQFLSFLQPFYFIGNYKLTEAQKAIFDRKWRYSDYRYLSHSESVVNLMIHAAKEMVDVAKQYDYIYDLTNIFSGHSNVYRDFAHVNEQGNAIIAENIYNILLTHLDGGRIK